MQKYKIEIQEIKSLLKRKYGKTFNYKDILRHNNEIVRNYGEFLEDYLHDVEICQSFAKRNREKMAEIILERTGMTAEAPGCLIHSRVA